MGPNLNALKHPFILPILNKKAAMAEKANIAATQVQGDTNIENKGNKQTSAKQDKAVAEKKPEQGYSYKS